MLVLTSAMLSNTVRVPQERFVPEERWRTEQRFHDEQARQRAQTLRPQDYLFTDDSYLRHESWIAPALAMLGEVNRKRVLDLGCGHGMASVVLARRGALVTACDLSLGYVREAAVRARANQTSMRLLVCNAERLPFADGSFDRIWGNAILHHLDMDKAARELQRVLAPGGVAVVCEPWGGNRWLRLVRQRVLYPGKERTPDEEPLGPHDLARLRQVFPSLQARGFQLLSMLGRVLKPGRLTSALAWCDALILRQLPGWQRYCRYVVLMMQREPV
jgi:SAM-dependent methyltransferase